LLGALSALGPFSIDMYLPGFADIARNLKTSVAVVGYSLTSYFIGIAVGQLVYGPITDRFGRKPPLLVGLAIYVAATVACALSPTIALLIGSRLIMALGAGVGMVVSRAIVRDLFPVSEISDVFSSFMLIIAVSPILAPSAGGYIAATLGWRFIFLLLGTIAVVLLLVVLFRLAESKKPDTSIRLTFGAITARYVRVTRNRQFLTYALTAGLSSASTFAYISGAPLVYMNLFHLSPTEFGWAFAANALGLIAGSQVSRLLVRRYPSKSITYAAVGAQLFLGALLAAGGFFGVLPLPGVFAVVISFLFCAGLVGPNSAALALGPFSSNAGSASALLGCFQMAIGSLATMVVSTLANGTAFPMMATMWGSILLSYFLLVRARRRESSRRVVAVR